MSQLGIFGITMAIAVGAGVVGLALAYAVVRIEQRYPTREQALRRKRWIWYGLMAFLAVILLFNAIDTSRHRSLNLAALAVMVGGLAFDWVRGRRRRTMS